MSRALNRFTNIELMTILGLFITSILVFPVAPSMTVTGLSMVIVSILIVTASTSRKRRTLVLTSEKARVAETSEEDPR